MNFFQGIVRGSEETPEQKQQADEARRFDMFKYDGVKAAKIGQHAYAVKCFNEALKIHEDLEVRDYLSQAPHTHRRTGRGLRTVAETGRGRA